MKETWTSNKSLFLGIFLLLLVSVATAQITGQGSYDSSEISRDAGFSIPEYSSQQEILTQLVAPFLLIAILLHAGIYRALLFTLADDPPSTGALLAADPYEKDRKRVRKQSLIMSLAITGMLVPTPFFEYINRLVAWTFGGVIYILFGVATLYFIYKLITNLW